MVEQTEEQLRPAQRTVQKLSVHPFPAALGPQFQQRAEAVVPGLGRGVRHEVLSLQWTSQFTSINHPGGEIAGKAFVMADPLHMGHMSMQGCQVLEQDPRDDPFKVTQ